MPSLTPAPARSPLAFAFVPPSTVALALGFVLALSACGPHAPAAGAGAGTGGAAGTGGFPGTGGAAGVEADPDFGDGSRLKFPLWRTADGFAQRQGTIYDSARREACAFARAADGKPRCLPDYGGYDSGLFADAACTEPLATAFTTTDPAPYARFFLPSAPCVASPQEYRELGPQLAADAVAYRLSDAGCVAGVLLKKLAYFSTGRILPPELFVAAEEVVVPPPTAGRGQLGEVHLRAEDGAWFREALVDVASGERCAPQRTSDGATRCVPSARYRVNSAGDLGRSDCTGPRVATVPGCPAGKADLVASWPASCPSHVQFYEAGPLWPARETFYSDAQRGCVAGPNITSAAVELGPEVPPDRFNALSIQHAGSGRLRFTRYIDGLGAGVPAPGSPLYDTMLEESCGFLPMPDGHVRCVPPTLITLFRDAACTEAVAVDFAADSCLPEPAQRYVMVNGRLHNRGAQLTELPTQLFTGSTGTPACASASTFVGTSFRYYAVGAAVETELVVATAVTY